MSPSVEIARRMSAQDGVISRQQALECGATLGYIRVRLDTGEWESLSSGVYANTSAPRTWERRLRAALLSHPAAYIAGLSAAFLHGFPGVGRARPEVLVPYGGNNRSDISRVIRARHFDKVGTEEVAGFPCTNVAETILTLSIAAPTFPDRTLPRRSAGWPRPEDPRLSPNPGATRVRTSARPRPLAAPHLISRR